MAPVGCRNLVGLPREELPVLCADEEVAEETEDTPEIEDEPLAIEYKEAEAGTLPVPHLPPGPDTPAVTPVPMLYSDAL